MGSGGALFPWLSQKKMTQNNIWQGATPHPTRAALNPSPQQWGAAAAAEGLLSPSPLLGKGWDGVFTKYYLAQKTSETTSWGWGYF